MGFYTTLNLTMHVVETNTFLKPHLMLCVVLGCSMTGKITISVAKTGKTMTGFDELFSVFQNIQIRHFNKVFKTATTAG